jgi:hypothetical protein
VAPGSATSDEYAQIRQARAFQEEGQGLKVLTKDLRVFSRFFAVELGYIGSLGAHF